MGMQYYYYRYRGIVWVIIGGKILNMLERIDKLESLNKRASRKIAIVALVLFSIIGIIGYIELAVSIKNDSEIMAKGINYILRMIVLIFFATSGVISVLSILALHVLGGIKYSLKMIGANLGGSIVVVGYAVMIETYPILTCSVLGITIAMLSFIIGLKMAVNFIKTENFNSEE